ncbi:MAG: hypothetical protein A3F84_18600 [Candidatus Handelsmanbacteria bacterium RIFCSPLOWO2_12_FULL_64_10]|uniref:histidine kinase n=1 Tax=Handelsmanbacteria sp. (strain RIFCSPLOWO2_12_FULL_64_10) TaxID=1817868 RepID=A0A1F6CCD4_HANXR|nr:MAG: hypothetical protein A3F84_18600 [Candidatus Handelsmanbacteria bacterium RIFCSPLOWO2_12_FULL_64_10]
MDRPQIDLTGARVLLVDDTPANLKLLRQALEPEGYRILIAPSGETALKIACHAHPDLILLDVQMPGLDGFETCRCLKENPATQDIPVIFVTARAETESVVEGFRAGGIDYVVKPFQSEEVLARVQTHLKIDRLTRQLEASNHALSAANQQIQQATERKSRFLANMSHELRTPINAIMGFTDLVLRRSGDALPGQQRDNLIKVKQSADHLLNLINDILDLSKIEAGRMEVNPTRFDVKGLIASCCDTVSPLVRPGVTLNYEVSEEAGEAHTDEAKLRQVVINLLSNALKFTEKGEVRVSVVRGPWSVVRENQATSQVGGEGTNHESRITNHEFLTISVSDTGIGIPPEALGYIFEEFRQVAGSSMQHKGTGLGLSITKKLVELLDGTISVESEIGRGSTFTVRIPMVYQESRIAKGGNTKRYEEARNSRNPTSHSYKKVQ